MARASPTLIGRPNRLNVRPPSLCVLAHAATSSGDGSCPRVTAQRRTTKPSIIFGRVLGMEAMALSVHAASSGPSSRRPQRRALGDQAVELFAQARQHLPVAEAAD